MDISDCIRATKRRQAFILAACLLRRGIVAERVWVLLIRAYGWILSDGEMETVICEAQLSLAVAS